MAEPCGMCGFYKAQHRLARHLQADLERQVETLTAMVAMLHPHTPPDELHAAMSVMERVMERAYLLEEAGAH